MTDQISVNKIFLIWPKENFDFSCAGPEQREMHLGTLEGGGRTMLAMVGQERNRVNRVTGEGGFQHRL